MQGLNIGIGVITYKRPIHLNLLLESINKNTSPDHEVVIFDDAGANFSGNENNSWKYKRFTTKRNCGVTINKNRALYYFTELSKKEIIILIEDDCLVTESDWVKIWVFQCEVIKRESSFRVRCI